MKRRRHMIAALAAGALASGFGHAAAKGGVVDLRIYKLKPGKRARFLDVFNHGALPMLGRHGIKVLGSGFSLHDPDVFFLIRAFASPDARAAALKGFYGSEEWKTKYDDEVLAMIDTYNVLVLDATDPAVAALAVLARP
jgi:NIPSNAP protein